MASGDLRVRFDIPSANDNAARQRGEAARAQALLEHVRATHAPARKLFERGIISRREMEDAHREPADAQAAVARSETARAAAEAASARSTVRAPFNGIVARRLHNPGDFVQGTAADPILRLIDPGRLEVTATLRTADAPRVLPDATARLTAASAAVPVRLTVVSRPSTGTGEADVGVRLAFVEPTTMPIDTPVEVDIDAEERVEITSGLELEKSSSPAGIAD